MITVIRTATAFPGMTGEAIVWAKEVAALVKRVTGKEQFVCTSFGGMLADCLDRTIR
jgi:beta-glucosidase-like glycosyl hydrolase